MKILQHLVLCLMVLHLIGCKEVSQSDVSTLEDLERGSYVSEICQGTTNTKVISSDRIWSFGKSCDASGLDEKQQKGCDSVRLALSSLSTRQLDFLDEVGMNIIVDTKEDTQKYVESAFDVSQAEMDNVSSFFLGEENLLASVVRVNKIEDIKKDVSFGLLRTLGDFLTRGALSTRKSNGSLSLDFRNLSILPNSHLNAQARLTKKFLSKVKNKQDNALLKSIAGNQQGLLTNFPLDISNNLQARNMASYVTTEAFHQLHCNARTKAELTSNSGKYKDLAADLQEIMSDSDRAIDILLSPSMSLTSGSSLEQIKALMEGNQTQEGSSVNTQSPISRSDSMEQFMATNAAAELDRYAAAGGSQQPNNPTTPSTNPNTVQPSGNSAMMASLLSTLPGILSALPPMDFSKGASLANSGCKGGKCNCGKGCSCGASCKGGNCSCAGGCCRRPARTG